MHLKSETYLKLVIIMASNRLNIHVALFFHVTNMYVKPGITVNLSPGNTNFCEKKPLADMMVEWLD